MTKALKIDQITYINMDTISQFTVEQESILLITNSDSEFGYCHIAVTDSEEASHSRFTVSINEFHRIKRELGKFMGVDLSVTSSTNYPYTDSSTNYPYTDSSTLLDVSAL